MAEAVSARFLALVVFVVSVILLSLCFLPLSTTVDQEGTPGSAVVVVVLGSQGDLARRFLWPALHELLLSEPGLPHTLLLYAASREPEETVENITDSIFSHIQCPSSSSSTSTSTDDDSRCTDTLSLMHRSTRHVQLKSADNYTRLSELIRVRMAEENLVEVGRMFYLSVPPFAYAEIAQNVHLYGRPQRNTWLRVVLEKPFGRDLDSALSLTTQLEEYYSEDELVRVDHYLGKLGVKQIWEFRNRNRNLLRALWNARNVDYVEVVAREKLDVKGRSGYYNKYGAIRDMLQNHLTEISSLVMAELLSGDVGSDKLDFLRTIYPPLMESVVTGQYAGYLEHLIQDGVSQTIGNNTYSRTPTFASVLLYLRDPDWSGVPLLLTSGKRMGEKMTFARVVFRNSRGVPVRVPTQCSPEMVFYIQGDPVKEPAIFISQHFSNTKLTSPFPDWTFEQPCTMESLPTLLQPFCTYDCFRPVGTKSLSAYAAIFSSVITGDSSLFVSTEYLLESWRVWSPLLQELEISNTEIFTYTPDVWKHVRLQVNGTTLSINAGNIKLPDITVAGDNIVGTANTSGIHDQEKSLSKLLGFSVHVSPRSALVSDLAEFFYTIAVSAVRERGAFHVAFPGGESLLPLHQVLALNYRHSFPWDKTHVWQTDERCVPSNSTDLNGAQLSDNLLTHVPVPRHQFHPMLVNMNHGLCSSDDAAPELYEQELVSLLPEGKLDFVFLGLGRDGHIASLFPEDALEDSWGTEMVQMVKIKEDYPVKVKQRMTLSYGGLMASRQIAILTIGEEKRGIFRKLRDRKMKGSTADLPVEKLLQKAKDMHLWVDLQCT